MSEQMTCTVCDGTTRQKGIRLINYIDRGCEPEAFDEPCNWCGGLGYLTAERRAQILAGQHARASRIEANRSLRDEAERRGMTVPEYSNFERGVAR